MDPYMITWIWLIAGLVLCLSELALPGLVVVFIGAAAMAVAGLRALGLVESLAASFFIWGLLSTALVFALRSMAMRLVGPPEVEHGSVDEDVAAVGVEVDVLEDCIEDSAAGRIRYQGSSWPAMTLEGRISAGKRARLLYRDNLAWIIEPASPLDAFNDLEPLDPPPPDATRDATPALTAEARLTAAEPAEPAEAPHEAEQVEQVEHVVSPSRR